MRNKTFIIFLAALLLVTGFGGVAVENSGAEEYPYHLENYQRIGFENATWPSFSTDGEEIVFLRYDSDSGTWSIWVSKANGSEVRFIYEDFGIPDYTAPVFSPDGSRIVFVDHRPKISLEQLTRNGSSWSKNAVHGIIYERPTKDLEQPSFSPDGKSIVYHSNEAGLYGDVWTMDSDGTNRTRLTFTEQGGFKPSFSLDGEKIVYQMYSEAGNGEVWIMNADGTGQQRLLSEYWYPDNPSFLPDGRILFASSRASPHSDRFGMGYLWVMDQDGSNETIVVPDYFDNVSANFRPSISSDGTRIVLDRSLSADILYVVEDPTGEWKDSDGDRVADICDPYPDDPDRGYYKDDDGDDDLAGFGGVVVAVSVLVAVPVVWWRKRERT